jgi:hypothetical protein
MWPTRRQAELEFGSDSPLPDATLLNNIEYIATLNSTDIAQVQEDTNVPHILQFTFSLEIGKHCSLRYPCKKTCCQGDTKKLSISRSTYPECGTGLGITLK